MRASEQTIQFLTEYYDVVEAKGDYSRYFAEDTTLAFGNEPTIKGRDQVVATFDPILNRIQSVAHELLNVWEEGDGVVIFETMSHWTLNDGSRLRIPAVGIVTVVDGLITDQRVFVDLRPLGEIAE